MAALLAIGFPYFYPISSLKRRASMQPLFQQTLRGGKNYSLTKEMGGTKYT